MNKRTYKSRRLNKKFVILMLGLVLMLGIFFMLRAAGLEEGGLIALPQNQAIDASLLQIQSDHPNLTYTFSYAGNAPLDFYRHRIIDPLGYVELISHNPLQNTLVVTTNLPAVFKAEYNDDTGNIEITVLNPRETYSRIVIIDPGHGGADVGAPIPGGIFESRLTLEIALKLYDLFEAGDSGIKAFMTRSDDSFINPLGRSLFANEAGDLLISIHTNTYADPSVAGTETLYNPSSPQSAALASIIQNNLVEELGTRNRGIIERHDLQMLNNLAIPAAIAEIDFKTNPQALANLQNPAYQQRIAEALYRSIVEAMLQLIIEN